jgi:hypothetical protein
MLADAACCANTTANAPPDKTGPRQASRLACQNGAQVFDDFVWLVDCHGIHSEGFLTSVYSI